MDNAETNVSGSMVRLAKGADAEQIAYVHMNTWLTTYRGIVTDVFLNALKFEDFVKRKQDHLSKSIPYWVAEKKQKIVGFATGNRTRDEDVKGKFDAEVYAIYVLKDYQRLGIGKALLKSTVSQFQGDGHRSMCIWVLEDNPSRGFYETMGGKLAFKKNIEFGGKTLIEVSYGWKKLPIF